MAKNIKQLPPLRLDLNKPRHKKIYDYLMSAQGDSMAEKMRVVVEEAIKLSDMSKSLTKVFEPSRKPEVPIPPPPEPLADGGNDLLSDYKM